MSTVQKDQASELRALMASQQAVLGRRPAAAGERQDIANSSSRRLFERAAGSGHLIVRPAAETRLTALPARSPRGRTARVVAIASGKGGVGKTNIAVNLAISLARRGRRIVLVDADLGTANVDVVMNVRSQFDLSHVLSGERTVDEIAVPIERGLHLIAGASGLASVANLGPFERRQLIDELAKLESRADIIVLDCGAGISQNVLAFTQSADELLVVTTPEPTALTDAYALVKVLSRAPWTPPMGLVVSQANTVREGQVVAERIASVAARFLGVSLARAGQILRDQHVALAVRQRVPFVVRYPSSPASSCIAALASWVDQASGDGAGRAGFFRRVFRFFY
ncbi:MAG: MinD/ParA family protein [Phycisphaerae bacterium]|nr:MinD/ParA family protein [Phycisphaerae bacterium]